jgi:hypothetical protein
MSPVTAENDWTKKKNRRRSASRGQANVRSHFTGRQPNPVVTHAHLHHQLWRAPRPLPPPEPSPAASGRRDIAWTTEKRSQVDSPCYGTWKCDVVRTHVLVWSSCVLHLCRRIREWHSRQFVRRIVGAKLVFEHHCLGIAKTLSDLYPYVRRFVSVLITLWRGDSTSVGVDINGDVALAAFWS